MKKVGKIFLLLSVIGMLAIGGLSLYIAVNKVLGASSSNVAKRFIGMLIAGFIFLFVLEALFAGIKAIRKDNNKKMRKAITAAIFILILEILYMVILSTDIYKILVLVLACLFIAAAFIAKSSKEPSKNSEAEEPANVEE